VADWLMRGGSITREDREVCEFGLNQLFSSLTNFIFVLVLGFMFGIPVLSVAFFIAYTAIRVYAGGYHADTPVRCFFISIVITVPAMLAIRYQQAWCTLVVFYCILGLSAAALILLSPVGNKNKMPDALEKVVYRRRMLRNLVMLSVVAAGLFHFAYHDYAAAVLCGIMLAAIMAITGKIKLLQKS